MQTWAERGLGVGVGVGGGRGEGGAAAVAVAVRSFGEGLSGDAAALAAALVPASLEDFAWGSISSARAGAAAGFSGVFFSGLSGVTVLLCMWSCLISSWKVDLETSIPPSGIGRRRSEILPHSPQHHSCDERRKGKGRVNIISCLSPALLFSHLALLCEPLPFLGLPI